MNIAVNACLILGFNPVEEKKRKHVLLPRTDRARAAKKAWSTRKVKHGRSGMRIRRK